MALSRKLLFFAVLVVFTLSTSIVLGQSERWDAFGTLLDAENDLVVMRESNLSVYFVSDTLLLAKRFFIGENVSLIKQDIKTELDPLKREYMRSLIVVAGGTPVADVQHLDYQEVIRLTRIINSRKELALRLLDTSTLLESRIRESEKAGIDVSEARILLSDAHAAIVEERYNEATKLISDAESVLKEKLSYWSRLNTAINSGTSFFIKYWWQILLITSLFSIIIHPLVMAIRKRIILGRIKKLKLEQGVLTDLVKMAQKDYLVNNSISKDTYNMRVKDYKTRLVEVKSKIPVLEASIGKKINKNSGDGSKFILFKKL